MTQNRYRRSLLALAASVSLAAGACSSGGPSSDPGSNGVGADGTGGSSDRASEEPPLSPLEEFFGWDPTRRVEPTEDELEQQRQVEELIADCMRDEGFEYVAVDPLDQPGGSLQEIYALPAQEFAERYGYGISTVDVRATLDQELANDPNEQIQEALSPEAQRAYQEALWGAANAAEKYGEPIPVDADERPGCRTEAEEEIYGDLDKTIPPRFESLFGEMNALWERIADDPRIRDAGRAWADCMTDAGFGGFEAPGDPEAQITAEVYELYGLEPPEPLDDPRIGSKGPPIPLPRTGSGERPDPQAWEELQDHEVAVAVADVVGCRPGYDEAYRAVRFEIEQDFLDANRAELEAYRDALAVDGQG